MEGFASTSTAMYLKVKINLFRQITIKFTKMEIVFVGWLVGWFVCSFVCLFICLFFCLFICLFVCVFPSVIFRCN